MQFLFYISPLTWGMILFDFHEACFTPLCLMILIIGILQKRKWLFIIGLISSLLIKEDVVMTLGILGLTLFLLDYFKKKQINKLNQYHLL